MKKIILVAIMFLLFAGVVSAASINGEYKGNPIVKLKSNGLTIDTQEVPAIILDGNTMVPISALRKIGLEVQWRPDDYSVDASLPLINDKYNPNKMMKTIVSITKSLGADYPNIVYDEYGSYISVKFHSTGNNNADADTILKLASIVGITDAQETRISLYVNNVYSASIVASYNDAYLWINKKISNDDFYNKLKITPVQTTPTASIKPVTPTNPGSTKQNSKLLLYSNDGKTYLGKLTSNTFDSDSIYNEFGSYGGQFSSKSIFNEFGTYGGEFSNQSPFNEFATKPPFIISDSGSSVGYLTVNTTIKGAISPVGLKEWLIKNGY